MKLLLLLLLLLLLFNEQLMNEASILRRIMEIEKGVMIAPCEFSIILHMIWKPNTIIVLLFIQIIPSLKTWVKHAYLHRR